MKKIERKIGICTFKFVLMAGLLIAMAGAANAITYREDFEAGYFDGAELQYHLGWFQTIQNDMTKIDKESSPERYRLGMGDWAFVWIAHPFSWSELSVNDYIILGMDFKTNSAGTGNPFNDDRVGWNIKDDDTDSDHICGVQFDDSGSVIEGYWINTLGTGKPKPLITDDWAEGHPARSTWYRLRAKFTKKGDTRFEVDVVVDELNDDGSTATANVITGSLDTGTLGDDAPHSKYFTAETIWPAFKNYDSSSDGPADNAYFHIDDGIDDVAEVEVTTNSATEGGSTGSFRVQLLSNPDQDVTVTCWPAINAKDIDLGSGRGQPHDLTFEHDDYDWETVTVTAYNDDEVEKGEVAEVDFSISSGDNNFNGHYVAPLPVKIKVVDNDGDDHVMKGPYLIYPDEQEDPNNMMVLWQLDSSQTCTLKWSEEEDLDPLTGSDTSISKVPDSDNLYRKTIEGLDTGTKYYYQMYRNTDGSSKSYRGSFYTPTTGDNVKFLVYGDTRASGDEGAKAYGHDAVCLGIMDTLSIDPGYQTFLLHVGDWVQKGRSESSWTDEYFNREFSNARSILANLPVQGCQGNHELNYYSGHNDGDLYLKYWPYPYYADRYWSFDYGPVHVTVVDQYVDYSVDSPQYTWLEADMGGTAATNATWRFILLHEPGYSAGPHSDNSQVRNIIQPLCEEYDYHIVFCGHNHNYARCLEDGVRHIIIGGGGAPLGNVDEPDWPAGHIKVSKKAFNFCEIDIRDDVLYLIARNREGSILDAFALAKDGIPETWSFIVKDSSDNVVAWFDNLGNLALKGDLEEESDQTADAGHDEFRIQDSGSNDIAIIDSTDGNMYIDGFLYQEQDMSQLSPEGFIVKNSSGDAVAFIDNSGDMYLKGALFDFPD